jgi:hypothetical protein
MGLPPEFPIERRKFSPKHQKIIDAAMLAAVKFRHHGCNFLRTQSQRDYTLARKAFAKLQRLYDAAQVDAEPRWQDLPGRQQQID